MPIIPATESFSNSPTVAASDRTGDDIWYIGKGAKENMYLTFKIQDNGTEPYSLTIYFEKFENKVGGNWTTMFIANYDNGSRTVNQTFGLSDFDMGEHRGIKVTKEMEPFVSGYYTAIDYISRFSAKPGHSLTTPNETWNQVAFPSCPNCTGPKTTEIGTVTVPAGTFNATLVAYKDLEYFWINKDLPFPIKGLAREGSTPGTSLTPHEFELQQVGYGYPNAVPEFPFSLVVLTASLAFLSVFTSVRKRSLFQNASKNYMNS